MSDRTYQRGVLSRSEKALNTYNKSENQSVRFAYVEMRRLELLGLKTFSDWLKPISRQVWCLPKKNWINIFNFQF